MKKCTDIMKAKERLSLHISNSKELLDTLKAQIEFADIENPNYGHSGSMGHVETLLQEVSDHFDSGECADCGNMFRGSNIMLYKYEPFIKLCCDCYDARMDEE